MLQGTGSRLAFSQLEPFVSSFITLQTMAIVKSIWKEIIGESLKGYSPTRWWSRWELMKALAKSFGPMLDQFIAQLIARDIAEETTSKMQAILKDSNKRAALELELAVAMDLEPLVTTTYLLEGEDGLCILKAYDMVEALRKFGRSVDSQANLPNTAALLRSRVKLQEGVQFCQFWSETDAPGKSGWYDGIILGTKPGHGQLCAVRYSNGEEMFILKSEEHTFRGNIIAHLLPEWSQVKKMMQPAFKYIETRLSDTCDAPYHMRMQHSQMNLIKVCYVSI